MAAQIKKKLAKRALKDEEIESDDDDTSVKDVGKDDFFQQESN